MAFRPRLLTQPMPRRAPDVDIIFHGQIMLRSDGDTCTAALNPLARNHMLSIEVRTKIPGQCDVIRMRHIGPLPYRRPEGMTIDVVPAADPVATWKCVGEGPLNFAEAAENAEDFRWILNLEGELFHNRSLEPEIFDSEHTIKLQGGEYYFRTGVKSPKRMKMKRSGGGVDDHIFDRIGAVARASLYLDEHQAVQVFWVHEGEEQVVRLSKEGGMRHEIYIENTPLFDPSIDDLERHDELAELYKLMPDVDEENRFSLTPFLPEEAEEVDGDFGTPDIPCQVVRLDHPDGD